MRTNRLLAYMAILLLTFSAFVIFPRASAQLDPALDVAVSIQPVAGIVREVGGEHVSVSVLLPEGVEPHAFSLTQSVLDAANAADMLVLTGHFTWEEDLAFQTGKPYLTLDDYETLGAQLLPLHSGYHENEHDQNLHGYWLLPQNAIAIANATRIMCSSLNTTHAQYWQGRFDEFVTQVNELQAFIAELNLTYDFPSKRVIITFPAEAYVAETLGLKVSGLLMEGENIFISGAALIAVEQALNNGSINLIIASDVARLQAAGEFAQQLSTDSGVPLVWVRIVFSALENFVGVLAYNTGVVTTGLGGGIPSALDFLTISMPVIIIAAALGVVAIIQLVLLIRCVRSKG